jgi:ATP-dependent Clp protease protease subunit
MKASRFGFTVAQKDPDVLELDVYDVIGDTWEEDAVTAKRVRAQLREAGASTIRVRINSLGGDVQDALSIYNQLSEHPGNVEVNVDGIAASAATIIAMAASPGQLRMAEASEFMIHEPRFPLLLGVDAAKARKAADRLDKETGILAALYAKRSERSEEEIRDWMRAETWFTATEALEAGLIDGLADESSAASVTPTMAAAALQRFRNVPERMVARAGITPVVGNGGGVAGVAVPLVQASDGRGAADVIREVAAPVQGVIVPPADTSPAAAVAAAVQPAAAAAISQETPMPFKAIAIALGLAEDATENQIRTQAAGLSKLLADIGAPSLDAARGVIEAGRAASAELPKAQARIAELEKATEDAERASTIATLEAEKRLTPPLREFVASCSIETLRAFAKAAPVVVAESQHHEAEPGAAAAPSAPVTVDGKRAYEHLTGPERIALRESDRVTFDALRNDWISRGQPLSNPAG